MTTRDTSDDPLTTEQLASLRSILVTKRGALAKAADPRTAEPRGDQPDMMDAATDATDDEEKILLSEHDRALLRQIDDALTRMDAGTYGNSVRSGEPIGYARLKAVPWARLTIQEAEDDERRKR